MDILQETLFRRLLDRYERTFGELPPFRTATLDDAITYMRNRLRECGRQNELVAQHR